MNRSATTLNDATNLHRDKVHACSRRQRAHEQRLAAARRTVYEDPRRICDAEALIRQRADWCQLTAMYRPSSPHPTTRQRAAELG